jgi:hypothetical protein
MEVAASSRGSSLQLRVAVRAVVEVASLSRGWWWRWQAKKCWSSCLAAPLHMPACPVLQLIVVAASGRGSSLQLRVAGWAVVEARQTPLWVVVAVAS